MSAAALPSPDQAFNLFGNLSNEIFFQKMASRGHVPRSQKEAQEMLALSADLEAADTQMQAKTASAAGPLSGARANLHNWLASQGLDAGIKQAQEASHVQTTASLMQYPDVYNAALSVVASQATQA